MFRKIQVSRKQVKNKNKGLYNTWTLLRPATGQEHLGPYYQMPNRYLNDFGKLPKFTSVQLSHKQFINENEAHRVKKKGV